MRAGRRLIKVTRLAIQATRNSRAYAIIGSKPFLREPVSSASED
jgi:hypothetical protein